MRTSLVTLRAPPPLLSRRLGRCTPPACSIGSSIADTTNAALWIAVAAYSSSLLLSDKFGRGWINPEVALRVGPSGVPDAGRGVFAAEDLTAATVLGHYPGRLRTLASYEQKRLALPATASYCWVLDDGLGVLDPTDEQGILLEPLPRFAYGDFEIASGAIPTTLALINEPSIGFDVNVVTEQRGSTLVFATGRDVERGEELFLDYGPTYDRSAYGKGSAS